MKAFFLNPWVIGILGGILSGLVVTFLSRFLFSRKEKREYYQKVAIANKEVIYAIRPSISEGAIPDKAIVDCLIIATARKYSIDKKDMYTANEIAEELIKEIMDSSFIPGKLKNEYSSRLSVLIVPEIKENVVEERIKKAEYLNRMVTSFSASIGLMAALMTMIFIILEFPSSRSLFSSTYKYFAPTISALIITAATFYLNVFTDIRYKKKERQKEQLFTNKIKTSKKSKTMTSPNSTITASGRG